MSVAEERGVGLETPSGEQTAARDTLVVEASRVA